LSLKHSDWRARIFGFLATPGNTIEHTIDAKDVLGGIDDLVEVFKNNPNDEVVFCLREKFRFDVDEYFRELEELGIAVRLVLDFYDYESRSARRVLQFLHNEVPIPTYISGRWMHHNLLPREFLMSLVLWLDC